MPVLPRKLLEARLGGLLVYIQQLPDDLQTELGNEALGAAENWAERTLTIYLEPKRIRMWPTVGTIGTDYDLEEDPLPWNTVQMMDHLPRWRMRFRPLISVQRIRFAFGPSPDHTVIEIPGDWVRTVHNLGIVSLMPYGMSAAVSMGSSTVWFLPLLTGGVRTTIPQFVCVDYTAGVTDFATANAHAELRRIVTTKAMAEVYRDLPRLVPNAVSAGGLSQSFGDLEMQRQRLEEQADKMAYEYNQAHRPIRMAVL